MNVITEDRHGSIGLSVGSVVTKAVQNGKLLGFQRGLIDTLKRRLLSERPLLQQAAVGDHPAQWPVPMPTDCSSRTTVALNKPGSSKGILCADFSNHCNRLTGARSVSKYAAASIAFTC
jgi:hypothetical protein